MTILWCTHISILVWTLNGNEKKKHIWKYNKKEPASEIEIELCISIRKCGEKPETDIEEGWFYRKATYNKYTLTYTIYTTLSIHQQKNIDDEQTMLNVILQKTATQNNRTPLRKMDTKATKKTTFSMHN